MVTKNYARFLNSIKIYPDTINVSLKMITTSGDSFSKDVAFTDPGLCLRVVSVLLLHNTNLRTYPLSGDNIGTGMFFGNGTTPPTTNDYKLESQIDYDNNGLRVLDTSIVYIPDKDTLAVYTYTVKNNSKENITISESAMISDTWIPLAGHTHCTFLWARDTFEPVILQPGETRAFTMTIGLE